VAAEESPSPKTAVPNPHLEQGALDQLKRMSATLAEARALTFRISSTGEVPAKTTVNQIVFQKDNIKLH
jgi:hypothetical protein